MSPCQPVTERVCVSARYFGCFAFFGSIGALDQPLREIISELSELGFKADYTRFTRRESQKYR